MKFSHKTNIHIFSITHLMIKKLPPEKHKKLYQDFLMRFIFMFPSQSLMTETCFTWEAQKTILKFSHMINTYFSFTCLIFKNFPPDMQLLFHFLFLCIKSCTISVANKAWGNYTLTYLTVNVQGRFCTCAFHIASRDSVVICVSVV